MLNDRIKLNDISACHDVLEICSKKEALTQERLFCSPALEITVRSLHKALYVIFLKSNPYG